MKETDYQIWKVIFQTDLTPKKFNGLTDKEKAGVFNSVRFAIKELVTVPMSAEKRKSAYRGIEKRIEKILFTD